MHADQPHSGVTQILHPDAKGRITLGKLAKGISSFHAIQQQDGKIILEPYIEIPLREQWLFNNKEALAGVLRGLKDPEEGKTTHYLGSFAKYADDEIE
jgi:hypothetical protein